MIPTDSEGSPSQEQIQQLIEDIRPRLERVRERMAAAARRSGRDPNQVELIAVTKGFGAERVEAAARLGLHQIGENRVEEARIKKPAVQAEVEWHMVGTLQTRKVRDAVEIFDMIHSVDRLRGGEEISKRAQTAGRRLPVLLEINISGEEMKSGFAPADLPQAVEQLAALEGIRIVGLMTMAPFVEDPEETRPVFRGLRETAEQIEKMRIARVEMRHLSMGMTNDFEVAIEEGATMVRLGTAIFGPRPPRD